MTFIQFLLQLVINLLVNALPTATAIYFGMRLAIKHQYRAEKRRGRESKSKNLSAVM